MPRSTRVPCPGSAFCFVYRTITFSGPGFHQIQLQNAFLTSRESRNFLRQGPTTPDVQRSRAYTHVWFRLFPVRSPLLGKSLLFSVPDGTEMFQFPPFALIAYVFSNK